MGTENPVGPRVSSLHYYPIKSCRGFSVETGVVGKRGFAGDRLLLLVDEEGMFITQREHPKLVLVQPQLEDSMLTLSAPGTTTVQLERRETGATNTVRIWKDSCEAVDQGEVAAEWLSDYLGAPARLVHIASDYTRQVNQEYAPKPSDEVGFADAYPFLLISEASLEDLNSRLETPLPMNRFRPNIVVSGCEPYAEDSWKTIRIGEVVFELVKPCARCVITTTDQETAEKGREPLRTLAKYRTIPGRGAMFGQNLVHANLGTIRVGDGVEILA